MFKTRSIKTSHDLSHAQLFGAIAMHNFSLQEAAQYLEIKDSMVVAKVKSGELLSKYNDGDNYFFLSCELKKAKRCSVIQPD